MAKDNRNKNTRVRRNAKNTAGKQVTLSQRAADSPTSGASKKKSGVPVGKIVLGVLSVILVIVILIFGFTAVEYIKNLLHGNDTTPVDPTKASVNEREEVAYYLFGLQGAKKDDGTTGTLAMLSLVCYDKVNKTVNVLQIPASTYLGDPDHWIVNTIGNVWSNPSPLKWCDVCRRQVNDSEIKDGKHDANTSDGSYCGAEITTKKGSDEKSLLSVFSLQYSITVDNFYLMPQEAFVKLIDLVGGVDVNLPEEMELANTYYESGIQTIDGEGALEFVLGDSSGMAAQVDNLVRQRQVFVALFARLFAADKDALYDDIIYPLMKGSTPIRTHSDINNTSKEVIEQMVNLVRNLSQISGEKIHVYMLPGQVASLEGGTYYSVHKSSLVKLLNDAFNPHDPPISEEHLRMREIANTEADNLHEDTFENLLVPQTGELTEESEDVSEEADEDGDDDDDYDYE